MIVFSLDPERIFEIPLEEIRDRCESDFTVGDEMFSQGLKCWLTSRLTNDPTGLVKLNSLGPWLFKR